MNYINYNVGCRWAYLILYLNKARITAEHNNLLKVQTHKQTFRYKYRNEWLIARSLVKNLECNNYVLLKKKAIDKVNCAFCKMCTVYTKFMSSSPVENCEKLVDNPTKNSVRSYTLKPINMLMFW